MLQYFPTVIEETLRRPSIIAVDLKKLPALYSTNIGVRADQISVTQRNLLMQHDNLWVFKKRYLLYHTTANVLTAYWELNSQVALLRAVTGLSYTINK